MSQQILTRYIALLVATCGMHSGRLEMGGTPIVSVRVAISNRSSYIYQKL